MAVLNKKDLADKVSVTHNFTKKESMEIVDLIFDTMCDSLIQGDRVEITGFGKFEVKTRSGRIGINPQTKEKIEIASSKVPSYKASKTLKDQLK